MNYSFSNSLGVGGREAELMQALQILLDQLNSGNLPYNPETLGKGGVVYKPGQMIIDDPKKVSAPLKSTIMQQPLLEAFSVIMTYHPD